MIVVPLVIAVIAASGVTGVGGWVAVASMVLIAGCALVALVLTTIGAFMVTTSDPRESLSERATSAPMTDRTWSCRRLWCIRPTPSRPRALLQQSNACRKRTQRSADDRRS